MQKCKNNVQRAVFSTKCLIISDNARCDTKEWYGNICNSYYMPLCLFITNMTSVCLFRGLADSRWVSLPVSVATLSSPLRARMLN